MAKKTLLILGIVVIAVILIGGGFMIFFDKDNDKQTELRFIENCEASGGQVLLPECQGCLISCDCSNEGEELRDYNTNKIFHGCGFTF